MVKTIEFWLTFFDFEIWNQEKIVTTHLEKFTPGCVKKEHGRQLGKIVHSSGWVKVYHTSSSEILHNIGL